MATKHYNIYEATGGLDIRIYGPGVNEVWPPEAQHAAEQALPLLDAAYAAGQADGPSPTNETLFYLISFEKTGKDPELCFWRPNANGYTNNLVEAGKYTRSAVISSKYHCGPNSIAVPVGALQVIVKKLKSSFVDERLWVQAIYDKTCKDELIRQAEESRVLLPRMGATGWMSEPLEREVLEVKGN